MAGKKRKAPKPVDEPPTKRNPRARAARRQDDPIWSTTNKSSYLVNEDLHAKFSDPKSYEGWTKEDWEEMHEDLPENVKFNEDGYSVPISYFKYDPDWRRLVREFQEDLGAGRYEPEWQAEAAQAMEERASGDFDKYKEDRFEEFWGQKQKVHWGALAGEATKIKLEEVIRSGVVKEGDYFSYSRVIGRRGFLIEKEFKIVKIENGVLTAAIPPGQLKYARQLSQNSAASPPSVQIESENAKNNDSTSEAAADAAKAIETANGSSKPSGEDATAETDTAEKFEDIETANTEDQVMQSPSESSEARTKVTVNDEEETSKVNNSPSDDSVIINLDTPPAPRDDPTTTTVTTTTATTISTPPPPSTYTEDIILISASTLNSLENQIIDIDGRTLAKNVPAHNSWKAMRGKRNNQDLGSLFDMREEYFVRNGGGAGGGKGVGMPVAVADKRTKGKGKGKG